MSWLAAVSWLVWLPIMYVWGYRVGVSVGRKREEDHWLRITSQPQWSELDGPAPEEELDQ